MSSSFGIGQAHVVLAFLALGLFWAAGADARIWHVRADAVVGGNGGQTDPFSRIQEGADVAVAGDTVLVYAGTYYETVLPKHSGIDSTDGEIYYVYFVSKGDGPAIVKAQQYYGFRIGEADSIGAVTYRDYIWIEGFYITNGTGNETTAHGCGIRTFSNFGVFLGNRIYDNDIGILCEGAGYYAESSNNRGNYIAHNIISNSGEAAVRIKHSSENDIVFNLMYHNGYRIEPSAAVTFYCGLGNRIINNTMWDNAGGGVHAYNGTLADSCIPSSYSDVRDNIFARPTTGLLLNVESKTASDTTSVFSFDLFWQPDSTQPAVWWGGNEFKEGGYQLTLTQFRNFADTTDTINSKTADGFAFTDPLFADVADMDFALLPGSPARDAGSRPSNRAPFMIPPDTLRRPGDWLFPPDSVWASQLTVFNTSEMDANIVDLGYHFAAQQYSTNPVLSFSYEITLFPNPYSGSGAVQFLLPNVSFPRRISGQIYNLRGQRVGTLRIPDNPLNLFSINWDARTLANGLYLLNIEVNGRKYQKKLLLLK